MASERQYYFIVRNKDILDPFLKASSDPSKDGWGLPTSDKYVYRESDSELDTDKLLKAGFITDGDPQLVSEEFQEDINQKLKYRQSVYYKNEDIIDIGPGDGMFEILEPGYYAIELTGGGGGTEEDSENFLDFKVGNSNNLKSVEWKSVRTSDTLRFGPKYTWSIEGTENKNGYYKITNESLLLFEGEPFFFDDEVRNRIDSDENLYGYTTLFFEDKDRYNPLYRKLLLFTDNSFIYKEFKLAESSSNPKGQAYYPENAEMLNYGDPLKGSLVYKANADIKDDKYPYWNYTYNLKSIPIKNRRAGGNSGRFFDIIELKDSYYRAYYHVSPGGSLSTIGSHVYFTNKAGDNVYEADVAPGRPSKTTAHFSITNSSFIFPSDQRFNTPFTNRKVFFEPYYTNKNDLQIELRIGNPNPDSDSAELEKQGKIQKNSLLPADNNDLFEGKGLGSEGAGIKKDFNNFNYYSAAEDGFLKVTFLAPIYSSLVTCKLLNKDGNNLQMGNGLISVSGRKHINCPINSFIEYRFYLDKKQEIDLNSVILITLNNNQIITTSIQELLDQSQNIKELSQKIKIKVQRKSDNIQILSFYSSNSIDIKLNIKQRIFKINFIKNNKLFEQSEVLSFENNLKGINRSLFYLISQNQENSKLTVIKNDLLDKIEGSLLLNDMFIIFKEDNLFEINFSLGNSIQVDELIPINYFGYEQNDKNLNKNSDTQILEGYNYETDFNILIDLKTQEGKFKSLNTYLQKNFTIANIKQVFIASPGELFFLNFNFNTIKIKVSQELSILNDNFFIGREGIDIFNGQYNFNSFLIQSFIFIVDKSLISTFNLTKRQYKVNISQENQEKLNFILAKDLYYPFENVEIFFNLSRFYKFNFADSYININQTKYNFLDFLDEDLEFLNKENPDLNFEKLFEQISQHFNSITKEFLKNYVKLFKFLYNKNSLYERLNIMSSKQTLTHGYFRNLPSMIKNLLNEIERFDVNFLMRHSDINLYFDTAYTDLSTLVEMQENEFKSIKIEQPGFYRVQIAGGASGNGGNGGDAGITNIKPKPTDSGRDDIYAAGLMAGACTFVNDYDNYYTLTITITKSVFPVLFELNELDLSVQMGSTSEEKIKYATLIFKNFIRQDELLYALAKSTIDGKTLDVISGHRINDTNCAVIYNPVTCVVEVKKIFLPGIPTNGEIQGFDILPQEAYLNTKSISNPKSGSKLYNKNTYIFTPPYNFHFYHTDKPTVEVHNANIIALRKKWNTFWFGESGNNNGILETPFTKNIEDYSKIRIDSRAQRIYRDPGTSDDGSTSDPFQYYLSHNGKRWPDPSTISGNLTFPREKFISLTYFSYDPTSDTKYFTNGGSRPGEVLQPFILVKESVGEEYVRYKFGGGSSIAFNQNANSPRLHSHGYLLPNGSTWPQTNAVKEQKGMEFRYFTLGIGGAGGIKNVEFTEYYMVGTERHQRQAWRWDIIPGLFMTYTPGSFYPDKIHGAQKKVWPLYSKDMTIGQSKQSYEFGGGGSSSSSSSSTEISSSAIVIKYGNGGASGRGGDSFLQKAISGTPGSSSAVGSWTDYDYTAQEALKPEFARSGQLSNIPLNEINGFQGNVGLEAYCFGTVNVEERNNKISEMVLQHNSLTGKIIQDQKNCLCFRGAYLDNIFYFEKGTLIIETGGKGGKGEDGYNSGTAEFGFSGGGGGAGCPSVLQINTRFFIYDDYYQLIKNNSTLPFDVDQFIYLYDNNQNNKNILAYNKDNKIKNKISNLLKINLQDSSSSYFNNIGENKLFIISGGRAGDMQLIRNPYIALDIRDLSDIDQKYDINYFNNDSSKLQQLEKESEKNLFGGGGGSSSSSTVSINNLYKFVRVHDLVDGVEVPRQFMGWEFNGLPGGNGGSGYIGGKGGNGGQGVSGMPNTSLTPSPVLQKVVQYGLGDMEKLATKLSDLFGGGGGSSSTSHTTITDTTNYAYTQHLEDESKWPTDLPVKNYINEVRSSYIGRARLIPISPSNAPELTDIVKLSFKLYDPLYFYYIYKDSPPKKGRLITLNGTRIPSFEYYRCLKEKKIFYDYTYEDLDGPHNYQQVPGFGGGYNTFLFKNNGNLEIRATFSQVILPYDKKEVIWEKVPAGGKPAKISQNILSMLIKTNYSDIILYKETCSHPEMDVESANYLKNYNFSIADRKIPIDGAGCIITYLCNSINAKNLDYKDDTNNQILSNVYK